MVSILQVTVLWLNKDIMRMITKAMNHWLRLVKSRCAHCTQHIHVNREYCHWSIYLNVVCPIWLQYWGFALSNIRILILFRDNNKNLKAKLNQVKPNNIQPEETTNFLPTGRVKWIVQKVVLTLCTLSKTLEGNRMETCCNLY